MTPVYQVICYHKYLQTYALTYERKKPNRIDRAHALYRLIVVPCDCIFAHSEKFDRFGRDHTRMTVCTIPTACCMFSQHIAIPNFCLPCLRSLSLLQEPRHFSPDEGGNSFESLFISLDMRRRALDRQFARTKICGMYVCKMYINIQWHEANIMMTRKFKHSYKRTRP